MFDFRGISHSFINVLLYSWCNLCCQQLLGNKWPDWDKQSLRGLVLSFILTMKSKCSYEWKWLNIIKGILQLKWVIVVSFSLFEHLFFPLNTYHLFSFEHLSPFPLNINLSHSDRALLCQIRFLSLLLTFFLVSTFVSFFLWPCLFLLTCPALTECPVSGFLHLWPQMTGSFPAENSCGKI